MIVSLFILNQIYKLVFQRLQEDTRDRNIERDQSEENTLIYLKFKLLL